MFLNSGLDIMDRDSLESMAKDDEELKEGDEFTIDVTNNELSFFLTVWPTPRESETLFEFEFWMDGEKLE